MTTPIAEDPFKVLCLNTDRFRNVIACPVVDFSESLRELVTAFASDTSNGKHPCFEINKLNANWAHVICSLGFEPWFVNKRSKSVIYGSNAERMIPVKTHSPGVNVMVVRKPKDQEPMILLVEELYRPSLKNVTGCVEPGQYFHKCAIEEVFEETGYILKDNQVFRVYTAERPERGRMNSDDFIASFIAFVDEPESGEFPAPVKQESEIKSVRWVPISDVLNGNEVDGKKISQVTKNMLEYCIAHSKLDNPGLPVSLVPDIFDPKLQCVMHM
jgi:8-oxo-dGTP pyrophosphatase MutT (NUDIX family)